MSEDHPIEVLIEQLRDQAAGFKAKVEQLTARVWAKDLEFEQERKLFRKKIAALKEEIKELRRGR